MTAPSTASQAGTTLAVMRVDDSGVIRGLDQAKGHEYLLVRLPFDEKTMQNLEAEVRRFGQRAEDEAASLARRFDLDQQKARDLVRGAAEFMEKVVATGRDAAAIPEIARESMEERAALTDVARAAQQGAADWTPRSEPPEAAREGSRIRDVDSVWEKRRGEDVSDRIRKNWETGAGGP